MKQVNLTITFDEEKLSALKRYMSKKELDLDREMTDASMPCTSWTAGSASVFRTSASSVYFAMKKSGAHQEERWKVFLDRLDGKQLLRETEPGYLTGSQMLRAEKICFSEDIVQNGNLLEFCMDGAIDVDQMFGTHTCDYDKHSCFGY